MHRGSELAGIRERINCTAGSGASLGLQALLRWVGLGQLAAQDLR